jgi:hypothetical protein
MKVKFKNFKTNYGERQNKCEIEHGFKFQLTKEFEEIGLVGCATFNIIYIIVCKNCQAVYVGESSEQVNIIICKICKIIKFLKNHSITNNIF